MRLILKSLSTRQWIMITAILGLILRIIVIPNPGFEADISFWKSWGLATLDLGLVDAAHATNNNYPTPFSYALGAMVWIYSIFADPHNFNEFWTNTNIIFLTIAKLFPTIADFGIFGIFLYIGKHAKKLGFPAISFFWYLGLGAVFLFNPVVIIDGAWWGQVDSVGLFIFLFAFVLALSRYPLLAGMVYMLAVMTKLQNMIYGPLLFLFLWQLLGYRAVVKGIVGSVVSFFILNIEFFLARDMARVIASLTENYDYFPLISLNAYNLWWIISGGHGMQMSDKYLMIGIVNAKKIGLFIFSSFYLFAILNMIFSKVTSVALNVKKKFTAFLIDNPNKEIIIRKFLIGLIIVNAAFFLFQTQSHDRYAFPLTAFLLLWGTFFLQKTKKENYSIFFLLYVLFSILYFYNLHTALVVNYPQNGLPIISELVSPMYTIPVAIIFLVLFTLFFFYIVFQSATYTFIIPLLLLAVMIIKSNLPLITKNPVSLTKLTPVVSQQGYGNRMINMPVNASLGFTKWSPLSVQYAFYRSGIGTHATSVINYDIGGHFTRFSTDYGIDTEAGTAASAIFEIYGDGQLLFRSEKMGRFEMPRHIDVNITGVKILGLVTTDAGDGKMDDHTDWLNPQLWP